MKERILKTVIYISGFLCLFAMLATRIMPLWNLVMKEKSVPEYWDKYTYGELYYFNNIRHFREDIPPVMPKYQFSERHPDVREARLFTFGDSYLDFSRNKQISERLAEMLQIPVFHRYSLDPIGFFSQENFRNEHPKILLYIRTERWIPLSFADNRKEIHLDAVEASLALSDRKQDEEGIKKLVKSGAGFLFSDRTEELLRRFIQQSYFLSGINSFIATLKFDLFGYVSTFTPRYKINDDVPWMFYFDQLNDQPSSFYYHHSEDEMNIIANNIARLSENLWKYYRIKLLFMPVPAKFTIYHDLIDPDTQYNNFLPRLYEKLGQRQIPYINLYDSFKESEAYVFFGTDEHWTEEGASIATRHAAEAIRELSRQQAALRESGEEETHINTIPEKR
jgi:hypothetical protein